MTNTRCCIAANTNIITLHITIVGRLSICSTSTGRSSMLTMVTLRGHVATSAVTLSRMAMVSLFVTNLLLRCRGCELLWLTASPIIDRSLLVLLLLVALLLGARGRLRACAWLRRLLVLLGVLSCSLLLCCLVVVVANHLQLLLLRRFSWCRCCLVCSLLSSLMGLMGGR